MKTHKNCQSCGMPAKMDKGNGGTERDGSKNKKYCSYCYKDGEFFMASEIDTAKKMQDLCVVKMKENGMNGVLAWFLTRGIPKLERWKK